MNSTLSVRERIAIRVHNGTSLLSPRMMLPWDAKPDPYKNAIYEIVDGILDDMKDPGHNITAAVVPPQKDRTPYVNLWNKMVRAVKEGK